VDLSLRDQGDPTVKKQASSPIWQTQLFLIVMGTILLIPTVACSSVSWLPTTSTGNESLESTVALIQATLEALETQQAQPAIEPTPEVIVVTATPLVAPTFSPTPVPTSTQSPSPTPTATDTSSPQNRTIVIVVTPTSPPTATPYPEAPIISAPRDQTIVAKDHEILLQWSWNGLLTGPSEYFEIKIRPDGQTRSVYLAQERGQAHDFQARLGGGRYLWTVQVVQGYFINNSGHPDDWVLESFRSPESEPRMIIIHEDRDDDDDDDDDCNDNRNDNDNRRHRRNC
jgi:hypothetical protein